jgi:hypothetical protein
MADGIELTTYQLDVLADISAKNGNLLIRQLSGTESHTAADVYVTVIGASHGHRVTPDGHVTDIGDTLPGK